MSGNTNSIGQSGENYVVSYLRSRGYRIRQLRWHCRWGEIDIIAYDRKRGCLVFVEVKTRRSRTFGDATEALSAPKKQHLVATISTYIEQYGYEGSYRCDAIFYQLYGQKTLKHYINVALD